MNDLVSVVIPSYNHEEFIEKAIISVYNQTYENIEIILIDDHSKDNTFKIAKDLLSNPIFRKRFRKIILERNEKNIGAHATLNKGVMLAEGTYISILNSDDYYGPERIEKILNYLKERSPFCLAFSNYVFVNEIDEEIAGHPLWVEMQSALKEAVEIYPSISFIFLRKQVTISTGNLLFSKSLYHKVGGFINLRYCHDLDFILQCIRYTEPIFLNEPLYYYRIHSGNTFYTVKELAIPETQICFERYFEESEYGELINDSAPCRRNYPFYFESIIKSFNLEEYYIRSISGYSKSHRVIDKTLFMRYELLENF
ncbi:MAG: glycosyltransferase [Nitrososphaeria archaeon]